MLIINFSWYSNKSKNLKEKERIDYNKWVADIKDYVKVLNKEEQTIPAPTPTKPKNFDKYNSFTALKDGYYYIYLKQNEFLLFILPLFF